MKLIGITPNKIAFERLKDSVRLLKEKGVSRLYVRNPFIFSDKELKDITEFLLLSAITPIISYKFFSLLKNYPVIFHFKESEKESISDFKKKNPDSKISVSCHSADEARRFLETLADYVFLSPVFKPYSKKNYKFKPLDLKKIEPLVELYGERVFLLGGMDAKRVSLLKEKLGDNIAVAGITMFFGELYEGLS